jgi:hypothetical protein
MRTEHHSGDEEWLSATELGEWLGIWRSKAYDDHVEVIVRLDLEGV